ncbi:N-acetyltransferase family protein [Photobacterium makurazakiensis]|uniref:GNAT family N-acetyltransferase n=1 Tax=Photobacterium makurazakiensis TaxID=2910234 RepID=UPI003D0DAA36
MYIQPCTYEQHAEAILDIFNDAILNTTALYEYEPRNMLVMKHWFNTKVTGGYPVIGAFDRHGELMGFATFGRFREQPAFQFTVEHSVYIHPDFRGLGVAKQLLNAIIDAAKAQNFHVMVGAIDAENLASLALHEKRGFRKQGAITQAGYKFDRWLDLVFYQYDLGKTNEQFQ